MNAYILKDTKANIAIIDEFSTLNEILEVKKELPELKVIINLSDTQVDDPSVITWKKVMEIGNSDVDETALELRLKQMAINECAWIGYTSGTTGMPKGRKLFIESVPYFFNLLSGVLISQDNLIATTKHTASAIGVREFCEVMVNYLPLCHAAGAVDLYLMMERKGTVYFADKMALKGTLLQTIQEAKPTIFFGVPRVFEKMREGLIEKGAGVSGLKKAMATKFKKAGINYYLQGKNKLTYKLGKPLFYNKVKAALGFSRCEMFYSFGAPLSEATAEYFLCLDIPCGQMYGLTETTGSLVVVTGSKYILGTVGKALLGSKITLRNQDEDGIGDIALWGRGIFMGYLNKEKATLKAIDSDGWITSGDLGSIDEQGMLYIGGRVKEILITSGGENVAPLIIESAIKEELPCISQAMVVGDGQKFLSVLLTFKVDIDPDTNLPTDQLAPAVIRWLSTIGCTAQTVTDVLGSTNKFVIEEAIQAGIDYANKSAPKRVAQVKKWKVLSADFSIPTGELGPTMKLKRHAIAKKYAKEIDSFYQ